MESMTYAIHKIGGTGLMMPYAKLVEWVRFVTKDKESQRVIIVVSAFAKITRMLQEIFENKLNGEISKAKENLVQIKKIHIQRCSDLFVEDMSDVFKYFNEIENFILHENIDENNPTISKAKLLRFGELVSSEIFKKFLLGMNLYVKLIDAQNMIFASGQDYCSSIPLQPKTSESISKMINNPSLQNQIILTQGYICKDRLLGLDGSDLTASLISLGLKSFNPNLYVKKTFWKDVSGVMVNGVVKKNITLDEYNSLQTVPVRIDAIKIDPKTETVIRSFLSLENPGTIFIK